jgi:hypothetical protein
VNNGLKVCTADPSNVGRVWREVRDHAVVDDLVSHYNPVSRASHPARS